MTKNSASTAFVAFIIFAIFCIGFKYGQTSGYGKGKAAGKSEAAIEHTEEIIELKARYSEEYDRGFRIAKEFAKGECDANIRIGDAMCRRAIEASYKKGLTDAIRHISLKCEKSKK